MVRAARLALVACATGVAGLLGATIADAAPQPNAVPPVVAEGRLLLPDGTPAADFEIAVVGQAAAVRSGPEGQFRLPPALSYPLTLLASSPSGEVFAPVTLDSPPPGEALLLRLEAAASETVTVLSGVAAGIAASPGSSTATLTRADLEARQPRHIAEALVGMPGASRSEGAGPDAVPVLRGLGAGRTLLLLDGARVTAERRAGPSAGYLDPSALASVEVARGPASVAYGSDAFGGVISLRYPDPEPGPWRGRVRAVGGFGGVPEVGASAQIEGGAGQGALLVQAHARDAGEQEAGGGEAIFNSSSEDRGILARYARPGAQGVLRVSFAADQARAMGKPQADSRSTRAFYPREISRRATVGHQWAPRGRWDLLDLKLFAGSYRLVTDRDRFAVAGAPRRLERSDVGARDASLRLEASRAAAGGRLQFGAESAGRFRLEAENERLDFDAAGAVAARLREVAVADARQLDHALFAVWQRPAGDRLALSAGARVDRIEAQNRAGSFGDRRRAEDAVSGQVAATVRLAETWTATLQASRGFRSPRLSDLYFRGVSGRGSIVGNPDLDSERSAQWDAALRWQRGPRRFALAAYDYRVTDLIERFRAGNDFNFRNRGEVTVSGVEGEAGVRLAPAWYADFAASLSRGEDRHGVPVDGIPPRAAHATLRWRGQGGRAAAFLRLGAFAREQDAGPNEVERPGYSMLDLGGSFSPGRDVEIRLHARNALDRRVRASADTVAALAAGRSLTVALDWRF